MHGVAHTCGVYHTIRYVGHTNHLRVIKPNKSNMLARKLVPAALRSTAGRQVLAGAATYSTSSVFALGLTGDKRNPFDVSSGCLLPGARL